MEPEPSKVQSELIPVQNVRLNIESTSQDPSVYTNSFKTMFRCTRTHIWVCKYLQISQKIILPSADGTLTPNL